MRKAFRVSSGKCLRLASSSCVMSTRQLPLATNLFSTVPNASAQSEPPTFESDEEKYANVGITQFVNVTHKVKGTIRQRSADFHIHELDSNGNIVQLTNMSPPLESMKKNPYLHFTLYKEGLDHSQVMNYINKKLWIPHGDITFTGMKDKGARTTQRICVPSKTVTLKQLTTLSRGSPKTKFGNYSYSNTPLSFGLSKGNHYRIFIRDLHLDDDDGTSQSEQDISSAVSIKLDQAMGNLHDYGFINYYGLQRLGFRSHKVAFAVMKGNWNKVFDLILTPWNKEVDLYIEAKNVWINERDAKKALKLIPPNQKLSEEIVLLRALADNYNDGKGDLEKIYEQIPSPIRTMYFTAFSSYMWNHMASYRIETYGLTPRVGDFVLQKEQEPSASSRFNRQNSQPYDRNFNRSRFKELTKNDLHSGYTIHDVLLPILGFNVRRYPNNTLQKYYEKLLKSNGLDMRYLPSLDRWTKSIIHGFHRPLIIVPHHLRRKIVKYNDLDDIDEIMPSDLNLMIQAGKLDKEEYVPSTQSQQEATSNSDGCGIQNEKLPDDPSVKDKIGAIIEFSLPMGSFAAMALREVVDFQTGLQSSL